MRAVGLMSGTSLDGIDIALIETDGASLLRRGARATASYPPGFRARLRQAIEDAKGLASRADRSGCLAAVERELTERHGSLVNRFVAEQGLQPAQIDVIGFHGQTVLHKSIAHDVPRVDADWENPIARGPHIEHIARVQRKLTVQLGDGPLLARLTGIDVVHDLRAADCQAGGEAPLVRSITGRSWPSCRSGRWPWSTSAASPMSPTSAATAICWRSIPGRAMRCSTTGC
jgi:anhydro-N-acetylmuramic acid kinase